MNLTLKTDREVLLELGKAIGAERRRLELRLVDLAAQAGINPQTLSRLERNGSGSINTLVAVLRAINRLEDLRGLTTPAAPSPLAIASAAVSGTPARQRVRVRVPGKLRRG